MASEVNDEFADEHCVRRKNCCPISVEIDRAATFDKTTYDADFIKFLADYGFYYFDTWLKCYGCGIMFQLDEIDSDTRKQIELIHSENAPSCEFVKKTN